MRKLITFPIIVLILLITSLYYKLFLYFQIPFPADLLVGSYFPWLDYYKMPVKNPLISDVFSQFFLWKYLAIDSIKNLEWPLWNPYSFMGNPLLATYHSAALYPLNILLLLPKYFGWGVFIYSQTLIAALTFYLFISLHIKSNIAKLSGAIIFSLSGLMTTWLEFGTAVHGMAWLPLTLYALHKCVNDLKFRFILLLIISLALIVLSGNAQVTTYSYIIVCFYFLLVSQKDKLFIKKAFVILVAILLSVLLVALQVLPSYELVQKSIRQTENYAAELNYGLLGVKDFFKFFITDYFGNPVTRNYWGNLNYSETSAYLGAMTLPLLIYSIFKIRGKYSNFLWGLICISIILTFDNSISRLLYQTKIPLLTSSFASRMLFVITFCVSSLASLALNDIIVNKKFSYFVKAILWSWAAVLGIILGTMLTKFFIWETIGWPPSEKYLEVYLNSFDYSLKNFSIAIKNSILPFTILSAFLFITFLTKKRQLLSVFVLLFLFLDLGRYFLKFNPFVPNELIFPKTAAIEFLQKQEGLFRIGREHAEILPPNTWTAYNLQSYEGYDPIYLNQYGKFIHFLNGGDLRSGNSTRYAEISSNYSSPFLDSSNVKFLMAIFQDAYGRIPGNLLHYKVKETGYKLIFEDKSTAILENPNAKERAYFAKKIIYGSDQKIKDTIMTDKNFDPITSIALSKDLKISNITGEGKAGIIHYSPNKVVINTETGSDEILVLADQYEEGWKATIDGKETEISPANLILRAIKVPGGSHKIVFSYLPNSFTVGLKISSITFLAIALASIVALKTRRF